jgi:probable HAF family extracellular repeat protein
MGALMSRSFPAHYFSTAIFAALLLASSSHAAEYKVTNLGVLGDPYPYSVGMAVNRNGLVVGYSYYAHSESNPGSPTITVQIHSHAFLYDGAIHDLGTLGGDSSFAYAVNDDGVVVGHSQTPASVAHAFLYDGMMHDLGTLGGIQSFAGGINSNNQVAGTSDMADGSQHAFLYDGSMHDLGTLGGSNSAAAGINDSGHVVGSTDLSGQGQHAFLYDGTMHDLGTLDGTWSRGNTINAIGHAVGTSGANFSYHGFLYDGVMHDIGDLGGGSSDAYAINALDAITGQSETADGSYQAFLYTPQGGMFDLNTLIEPHSGWSLALGWGINDAGQVTGWGFIDGQVHAFLLSPVPEPASLILVAAGFFSLVPTARWRTRRSVTRHHCYSSPSCFMRLQLGFAETARRDNYNTRHVLEGVI